MNNSNNNGYNKVSDPVSDATDWWESDLQQQQQGETNDSLITDDSVYFDALMTCTASSNKQPKFVQQNEEECILEPSELPMTARLRKSHSSSNMLLMRRVSSGFFSVGSMSNMACLNNINNSNNNNTTIVTTSTDSTIDLSGLLKNCSSPSSSCCCCYTCANSVDALYHDIMMNVMSYLSLQDLSSYSQTAKRPNTDCCDYLQLQLELALFPSNSQNHDGITRATTSEISLLVRLASLDFATAEELVDQYRMFVNNTTTHSETSLTNYNKIQKNNPFLRLQQKLHDTWNSDTVVAATTTTMIGLTGMIGATAAAASSCASTYGTTADCTTTFGTACACVSFAAAAVASRYYSGISSTSSTNSNSNNSSSPPSLLLDFIAQKLQALLMTVPQHDEGEGLLPVSIANQLRYLRQRYQQDNLTSTNDAWTNTVTTNTTINISTGSTIQDDKVRKRKPVGCVGMYNKVLKRAQESITSFILNKRRTIFSNLTEEEQKSVTAAFIDSCASDDEIESLKSYVRNCGVDVNGFFVGSENDNNDQDEAPAATAQSATTCALHAAAFHGSTDIVEFLCRGVSNKMYGNTTESGMYQEKENDDKDNDDDDGGLCDVNIVDSNGWSALHFAVGCSGDTGRAVVRILAKYGCNLYHEANNGYTPYHWAQRLSNHAVADELKRLGADARFVVPNNTMELKKKVLMCSAASAAATIPLSIIATRVLHHGNN